MTVDIHLLQTIYEKYPLKNRRRKVKLWLFSKSLSVWGHISFFAVSMSFLSFSFFGKAFEQAATSTNCRMLQDSFDSFSKF